MNNRLASSDQAKFKEEGEIVTVSGPLLLLFPTVMRVSTAFLVNVVTTNSATERDRYFIDIKVKITFCSSSTGKIQSSREVCQVKAKTPYKKR